MRRGIAYVYLALLVATAVAIGLLALVAAYTGRPTNTGNPAELGDRLSNLTVIKMVAHYCAARASTDRNIGEWPSPGYSYVLTDEYNLYARSSGRPLAGHIECYGMTKENKTIVKPTSIGVVVSFTVMPQRIDLTERMDTVYAHVVMNTSIYPVIHVNYSLGVADFKVDIYYRTILLAEEQGSGAQLLNSSLPIKVATSTLKANGTTRDYPVDVRPSDLPGYDWVISTSFVLDPTGPNNYVIDIDLYLFDGIKQTIRVGVSW